MHHGLAEDILSEPPLIGPLASGVGVVEETAPGAVPLGADACLSLIRTVKHRLANVRPARLAAEWSTRG